MLQPNINSKQIKEVYYDATLQGFATSINFTIENAHTNAFIEQIVLNFASADSTAGNIVCTIKDRGNSFPNSVNGFKPVTYSSIGYTTTPTTMQNLVPNSSNTQVTIFVYESVQDSDGVNCIYVQLSKTSGTFNVPFTMTVIYRPETTYNSKLDTRNQIAGPRSFRVLSQTGIASYADPTAIMANQTPLVSRYPNYRNNVDTAALGFAVSSTSPIFYFGGADKINRVFLGFNSDCTPNLGIVTFSYYNGVSFTSFSTSQLYNGCQGPGTYQFAYDGVITINSPANWVPLTMANDPFTVYNTTMVGLGTLATNYVIPNPGIYWIQCQVGFATTAPGTNQFLTVSAVAPLIDPAQPLTTRKKLIPY
jgi:hypothetical protein